MTSMDKETPISEHHHYDHYSTSMAERLDGFFGRVDERLNNSISSWVAGKNVLDVGCGFGSLSASLVRSGFDVVGIDMLEKCVVEGQVRYPGVDLRVATSEELDFPDKSFDTVVLKDVIHHVYEEDDISAFLAGVVRILRKRLIVVDPNPTLTLLIARRLIGHVDPVCSPLDAIRLLREAGFNIKVVRYSEILAFPLSGGYVGPELIPRSPKAVGTLLLGLDAALMRCLRIFRLDKYFGWRYLLVADLESSNI